MQPIDLVFEGGGAKGMVFVGALQELFGIGQVQLRPAARHVGRGHHGRLAGRRPHTRADAGFARRKGRAGQVGLRGFPGRTGRRSTPTRFTTAKSASCWANSTCPSCRTSPRKRSTTGSPAGWQPMNAAATSTRSSSVGAGSRLIPSSPGWRGS